MGLPAHLRVAAALVAVALLWSGVATTSVVAMATTDADVAVDTTDETAYAVENVTDGGDPINETTDTTDDTVDTTDSTTSTDTTNDTTGNLTETTDTTGTSNTTDATNTTDTVSETTDTVTNTTESVANATVGESLDVSVETVRNVTDDLVSPTERLATSTDGAIRATSTTGPRHATTASRDATCECATRESNATAPAESPSESGDGDPPNGEPFPAAVTTALGATLAAAGLSSPTVSASGSAVGSLLSTWWRRVVAAAGYSRYGDSDPLADDRRERIYDAVSASPGVSQSSLADRTDVPLSSLRHHLDVLAHEDLVVGVRVEGRRRYFPAEMADPSGTVGADVGVAGASVLEAVSRLEPATGTELADALDRDPSTVSHHLDRLDDAGLVERERSGRAVRNQLTPAAQRVLAECPFSADAATADD